MKVLFVIATLDSGGAERVVTHLANHLCARHDVAIVTFWNKEPFYSLSQKVEYIKLDIMKNTHGLLEKARYFAMRVRILRKLMQKHDPDVVVSFLSETNIIATVAAKLAKKPIVISERIAHGFLQLRYLRIARRLVYPLADALVTQTEGDRQNYSYLSNVHVIPNPLPNVNCRDVLKDRIILGVGRLEEQKGFADLIEAFVQAGLSKWRLVIAGEGSQRERLERLIAHYGASNIEFIGRQKNIWPWYGKASVFAMTSHYEGFPNALLEAMACGCACVSYDCPYGPAELLGDDRGILVGVGDKRSLASALRCLADDPQLRTDLGHKAQRYAKETYRIENIAKKWEEVMEEVVKDR